ncbi:MAG: bifunctional methylenetetrahydrofolate dehydrogenase/methenyltetrahydrofolate cyclohydrolase FolD [Acidithiobacillus sp.]
MSAQVIDGKAIAHAVQERVSLRSARFLQRHGRRPGLAVVLVGESPASQIYVKKKRDACTAVGIQSFAANFPAACAPETLLAHIDALNDNDAVDGILIQLPLPPQFDTERVIEAIAVTKDVDGFHPYNIGRLALRAPLLRSCTPAGIMTLLAETGIAPRGMEAVIVGASNIVGRPMALELLLAGATVTVCHRFTQDLEAHVRRAQLLVAAVGKPGLIRGEWIRPGAVVIDVGINRLPDGRLAGDVDFDGAIARAAWITPVPGGVGPLTVATLLSNTLDAAERRIGAAHV